MKQNYLQDKKLLPEEDPNYNGRIAAIGFGLNMEQQEALAELQDWHEKSKLSYLMIGGPLTEERKNLLKLTNGI